MTNLKTAKKALRQSTIKKIRNLRKKRELSSLTKNFKKIISEKGGEEAKKILPDIYKRIDKNKKAGILKKNTASRKKSKIAKMINKLK